MIRNSICSITVAAVVLASSIAAAQTVSPSDANDSPIVPALSPVISQEPPTTAPAAPDVVVPSTVPTAPDVVVPSMVPTAPDVVVPSTVPTAPDVVVPSTVPSIPTTPATDSGGDNGEPLKGKYAGSGKWLKMAELEIRSIKAIQDGSDQQKDYLLGALMTGYLDVGELKSARRVFEEISKKAGMFWMGSLIAPMLVNHDGEEEAFRLLSAIPEGELRLIILRQLAEQMVRLDSLAGLKLVSRLQKEDRTFVLGEWAKALIEAGKMVDARIAAEGAPLDATKSAIIVLSMAGEVAHGKKTLEQALAKSGKLRDEFMPYLMALRWDKIDNLDPNLAAAMIAIMPAGPARAGIAIGMAKNFIAQRRPGAADKFADAMVADLKKTPVDRIPGSVYLDIAIVMGGVGRFDKAKTMFEQAVADRSRAQTIDQLMKFFEVLIEADGGDMADRLGNRMPGLFRQQMLGLWAKFYIKHGQADRVRDLLANIRTPGQRATLYLGVAEGLRDLADKPEARKP